jgi:hypothetical protein
VVRGRVPCDPVWRAGGSGSRGRQIALVTLAVACACGVLAVPAFAFVSRSTKSIVIPAGSTVTVTPKCPSGEHVSFGGVISQFRGPISSTNTNARQVITTAMHRISSNAGALTATAINSPFGAAHFTAVGYCDRGTVPTVVSKTVRVGAEALGVAKVKCPAGTVGVGGGYASGSGPHNVEYLLAMGMVTTTELGVAISNGSAPTTLTALVYCAPGVAPAEHDKTIKVAGHKTATAEATCPAGTKLAWGGLAASIPSVTGSNDLSEVIPFSWYAPSTTQWKVSAYGFGNKAGTITAVAYCR